MYIGEIIKEYREKNKISQRDFAKRTSLSHSYINTLEKIYNPKTGKPYSITTDVAIELAQALKMSIEELLFKTNSNQEFTTSPSYKTDDLGNIVIPVPILGTVKAGYDYMAQENWEGTIDVDKNLVGNGEEYFALRVKGDSMSPVLIENDIVIVKKQNDFENGDIVVALINGEEATIKKGKKSDAGILLQPFNNNYEPLIFTYNEMKEIPVNIIGIVKKLDRTF